MKIKILSAIITLTLFACTSDNNNPEEENNTEPINILTLTNSESASIAPFIKPRERIIFENNLYVVDRLKTYKYDFNSSNWEILNQNNTELDFGVADYPYFDFNISFIRNGKWYIINRRALWSFDFTTHIWTNIKSFGNSELLQPIGIYDKDTLYIFSDIFSTIYTYNFETNSLIEHSTFEERPNYGQLVKSIFKINGITYFTKINGYDKIQIYKWNNNYTEFELLNEYQANYIAQGSGFVFNDKIIFGLGGEASADGNGNITGYNLNDKFYYYDTTKNEFGIIKNSFYQGRYVSLPIEYNNEYYLLGGKTVSNNQVTDIETLDKLYFEYIEQ